MAKALTSKEEKFEADLTTRSERRRVITGRQRREVERPPQRSTDIQKGVDYRHELFIQKFVECGNATQAYCSVFERTKRGNAHSNAYYLMKQPAIAARIAALQAEHREMHNWTIEVALNELEEARELAIKMGTPGPAVAATMGKAKMLGLANDKLALTGKDGEALVIHFVKPGRSDGDELC